MTVWSGAIMLFLVMDPIGNSIAFVSILDEVEEKRRSRVILRELLIALGILFFFLFFGKGLLSFLQIQEPALSIAGGILLFLISLKLIFPPREGLWGEEFEGEPFIVPLATPLIAGPSAVAVVMLMASRDPARMFHWSLAILISWLLTAVILLLSNTLTRRLGKRFISGIQKLMGMILIVISVQMLLSAFQRFFQQGI